jgi:ABC-type multidrug transport system ATPase subunit/ABC-type multidrug transport system permease subunit
MEYEWIIGSSADCDVVVEAPVVSRQHCRLRKVGDGFLIEDLGSVNGTFVNGIQVTASVSVKRSDRITLGQNVPMLWPDADQDTGAVQTQIIRIGRAPDNDVVIPRSAVSSYHAQIILSGDSLVIEDLGSTNGTGIGTPANHIERSPLSPTDMVFFGSHAVQASKLLGRSLPDPRRSQLATDKSKESRSGSSKAISFSGREMTFGRSPDCDQVLDFPMISWKHARMIRTGSSLIVEDLNSTNGTFVNGLALDASAPVNPGDTISLGSFSFVLTADGSLKKHDFRGNLTLEARSLAIDVPGLRLLDKISLTINPSEFTGLMGPSGAGKTTLMKAMNGYTPPSNGNILLNGEDLYRKYNQFRGQIGYVPQDDIIHSDLTVAEALYFTARLRLPSDFRDSEIHNRIKKVLVDLDIEHTQNVLIGSPQKKGISGGQRKRVNLAMELLTDPSLLFLDEPTSGLSSEDALSVMKVLRNLADSGKTILLTIHQPSLEIFQLLDNLVVVSRDHESRQPGRMAYYGPAYPDSVKFFNPDGVPDLTPGMFPGPDEVLRGLARGQTDDWVQKYSGSDYQKEFVSKRRRRSAVIQKNPAQTEPTNQRPSIQWRPLVQRCLAIKMKDRANTLILLAQAPIIAILIWQIFGRESSKAMDDGNWLSVAKASTTTVFLLSLSALWFGCSNSIREIVAEWAIYHRERMVNLRIVPYIGSKFAVLGSLCVVQCICLLGIVHWGNGLEGSGLGMLCILVLVSLVGLSIGLLVSALVRTSEAAVAILPLILLPMVMLGGVLMPLHQTSTMMQIASHVMPSRWAFESVLLLESDQRISWTSPTVPGNVEGNKERDMAETSFPKEDGRTSVFAGIVALLTTLCLMLYATGVILYRRDVHQT